MTVQITNPVPGDPITIKMKHARSAVKQGRAAWTGKQSIKWTQYTEDQMERLNRHIAQLKGYDYDVETNLSSLKQAEGLPCNRPIVLFTIPSKSTLERVKVAKPRILVKDGVVVATGERA